LVRLFDRTPHIVKPKLLVLELWQVGDLVIASQFIRQASELFDVTVLAKPFAFDLRARFWPQAEVVPINAPWTAFSRKYVLYEWPWRELGRVGRQLRSTRFDVGVSARWDPREHLILALTGARRRLGFPSMGSGVFLTNPLALPDPGLHRYEYWRTIGASLDLKLPPAGEVQFSPLHTGPVVLVHTGARQSVRVWPMRRYQNLVAHLRAKNRVVRVVCNPDQRDEWMRGGETDVAVPTTITDLLNLMSDVGAFIGNDSGPGHLAAFLGIPTFTLFGPQVPAWFVPLHPSAVYIEGKACPYKPCSDYCRFPEPHCLWNITEAEVCTRVDEFLATQLG
jgi:ADP-heptose:LPS heptosyltransferase